MAAESCSLGKFFGKSCERNAEDEFYVPETNEREVLKLRTGCETDVLCNLHRKLYLTLYANHQRFCCDPLLRHPNKKPSKDLREITLLFASKYQHVSLIPRNKLCSTCRRAIPSHKDVEFDTAQEEVAFLDESFEARPTQSSTPDKPFEAPEMDIAIVNESLSSIGESPVQSKKLTSLMRYPEEKLDRITGAFRKKLRIDKETSDQAELQNMNSKYKRDFDEIMTQLKEKFHSCEKRSDQMQVLTVLPQSWSIHQIQNEFGISNYMARATKKLVEEKGILSTPNPKPGRAITDAATAKIKQFYENDEISRQMPGKKDCVTMDVNGKKEKVQKRLILCNLKEAYQRFKDESNIKVGFSKFASLRPKNVVLPGGSGTHSVCVCTIHQNVKLMLEGAKISTFPAFRSLVSNDFNGKISYHHLLAAFACNPSQPECYLGQCEFCGDTQPLKAKILEVFESLNMDEVTYKSWVTVDRTSLETICKSVDDFTATLCEALPQLQRHAFIARSQAAYMKAIKDGAMEGKVLIVGDFAENYSFVLQDAAQGFHWNNSQATIHPFVIYHRFPVASDLTTSLNNVSFVIVSDCLTHDTIAVHRFQQKLFIYLKDIFPIEMAIYFSDGAASQYKNRKNFLNLAWHQHDFGIPAEWHFFATSHGKGPCDGVGGTVKRLAARASLQRPYADQLQTPLQLFSWAKESIPHVTFSFVGKEEIEDEARLLSARFENSITIHGTQKLHAILPVRGSTTQVAVREYSASPNVKKVNVSRLFTREPLQWEHLNGYVTCKYDDQWWLAYILEKKEDTESVEISFLHPAGPSPSFTYPRKVDKLVVPRHALLTKVEPITATGRTYTLTEKEQTEALNALENI